MKNNPQMLTIKEVAETLRVSDTTIRRWITEGKIKALKFGRQWRFRPTDIAQWLENGDQENSRPEKYIFEAVIETDEDRYHAYVLSMKGCRSWGRTQEEAEKNIQEALDLYLEALIEDGDPIPGVGIVRNIKDIKPIIKIRKEAVV